MSITQSADPSWTLPGPPVAHHAAVRHPAAWDGGDLDPFDRMLLTTDGTVTTLLEACAGEPIVTRTTRHSGPATLAQLVEAAGRWWHPDARLLGLAPTERLVVRRVSLRGACSGVGYVFAESLVASDRLPGGIANGLRHARASLGRLLGAGLLESRREIHEITTVRAEAAGDHLAVAPSTLLVRRCYTIVIGARPVAAVSEWLAPGRLGAASSARPRDTRRHGPP